jgi:lipoprotein-anchoring transpeptidase ErfK/SrfK
MRVAAGPFPCVRLDAASPSIAVETISDFAVNPIESFERLLMRLSIGWNWYRVLVVCAMALASAILPAQAQTGRAPIPRSDYAVEEQPGALPDEVQLPAIYQRQAVYYRTAEAAGTIIIDTADRYLYLIQGNNRAIRYGIGVGRDGFQWEGLLRIARKAEWPDWVPPPEMIERQPYLPRFMAGGPGNPLGARALYLGSTIYRIHGTNQPETIGSAISSGCFRLVNGDVMDLYDRVPVGTKVIIQQKPKL